MPNESNNLAHIMRDYHHAEKLYRTNKYALAPKAGFIYFVNFNISTEINSHLVHDSPISEVLKLSGLLAKSVQLPKFKVTTETLNQYNRKTNVQTKLNYEPVRLEFHDDYASNTNTLWELYYQYYYADSSYVKPAGTFSTEFDDTKFSDTDYLYGYRNVNSVPFFTSIDIYVLHQGKFTCTSLINPLITSWEHDTLDQTDGTKMLKNSMTLAYENVFYTSGEITDGSESASFKNNRYDTTPTTYTGSFDSQSDNKNTVFSADVYKAGYNYIKPPASGQLTPALLALSNLIRSTKIAKELTSNPKQAWSVYGFNIKNVATNALQDAIFASAASVTPNTTNE